MIAKGNLTGAGALTTTAAGHEAMSRIRVNSWSFVADQLRMLPLLAAIALLSACSKEEPKPVIPPAPVSVREVVQKSVPVQVRAIGNIQPITTVQIKSHVSGEVAKVNFQEGQDVKKGTPLFVIDPRPFEALLLLGLEGRRKPVQTRHRARAEPRSSSSGVG